MLCVIESTLLSVASCPWDGFDPATIEFCEERLCAWVVEPSNAYTSLTKTIAGFVILWAGRRHRDALIAMGVACVLQGFLGFSFHATGTFWGEALDVSGMFLFSGMFLAFAARRVFGWSDRQCVLGFFLLVTLSVAILLVVRPSGIWVFTAQIVAWVVLEALHFRRNGSTTEYRFLRYLVISFVIAFIVWTADKTGFVCDPDNHVFSAHSLWHLLTSLALVFFYAYEAQFRGRTR